MGLYLRIWGWCAAARFAFGVHEYNILVIQIHGDRIICLFHRCEDLNRNVDTMTGSDSSRLRTRNGRLIDSWTWEETIGWPHLHSEH